MEDAEIIAASALCLLKRKRSFFLLTRLAVTDLLIEQNVIIIASVRHNTNLNRSCNNKNNLMEFTFTLRWSPYKARHKIPLRAHLLMTPPFSWKLPKMNYNNDVVVVSNADGKTNIAGEIGDNGWQNGLISIDRSFIKNVPSTSLLFQQNKADTYFPRAKDVQNVIRKGTVEGITLIKSYRVLTCCLTLHYGRFNYKVWCFAPTLKNLLISVVNKTETTCMKDLLHLKFLGQETKMVFIVIFKDSVLTSCTVVKLRVVFMVKKVQCLIRTYSGSLMVDFVLLGYLKTFS
ncbi:hypothetical protein QTP88_018904 [Uroleucon formosanum]